MQTQEQIQQQSQYQTIEIKLYQKIINQTKKLKKNFRKSQKNIKLYQINEKKN